MDPQTRQAWRVALAPTALYFGLGILWILASDRLLYLLVQDPERLSRLQTYKGWFYVSSTAALFFFLQAGVARRVQRLQQALAQSQKMEALGRMAASIAHDFRNILAVAMGNLEMARTELGGAHPAQACLSEAQAACESGRAQVQRLMSFARGRQAEPQRVALGSQLLACMPLIQKLLPPGCHVDCQDRSAGAQVLLDPGAFEQALLNLAANAADAFGPQPRHPRFELKLQPHHGGLRLSASDNAGGMAPEVQARIFEPFFTTKPAGAGTGLGLASVFTMMQACGGSVSVESEPGDGSAFYLDFPVLSA